MNAEKYGGWLPFSFWTCWSGSVVPLIVIIIMGFAECKGSPSNVFFTCLLLIFLGSIVGLCFVSALCVRDFSRLARMGMITVGMIVSPYALVTAYHTIDPILYPLSQEMR